MTNLEANMKKITLITLAFCIFLLFIVGCNSSSSGNNSIFDSKTHTLVMKNPEYLHEKLNDVYKTGETVVVRISIILDVDYTFLVNGREIEKDPWEGGDKVHEYWQFSFIIPDEDVICELVLSDGVLG